jgi:hypothetical protein
MSSVKMWSRYGNPTTPAFKRQLVLWDVPADLEIGVIPRRIYCHRDLVKPLSAAFKALIDTGAVKELKTWDGCYNPRAIRGYERQWKRFEKLNQAAGARYLSTHAWGLAIDVNAFENGLGRKPKLSKTFIKCFTDNGFTLGGTFKRLDGMHFELSLQ